MVRDIERYAFVIWSDCVARDISIAMRCRDIDGKAVVICRELRDGARRKAPMQNDTHLWCVILNAMRL